jgi:putative membrane protein
MLITKALHIVFVTSWFAGLFYLPRIFVNLAMEEDAKVRAVLLRMARKLYRFMLPLAVLALALGLGLWLHWGIGGPWLHGKLLVVLLLIGYHHACGRLLRRFERGETPHGPRWFRIFNEVPVILLLVAVLLVVTKGQSVL